MLITYDGIRTVHRAEKLEPLGKLPENFWPAVRTWLAEKMGKRDSLSLLEFENAKKMLEDIVSRRQRKIIFAALGTMRGLAPPAAMTQDEQKFFDKTISLLKENTKSALEEFLSAEIPVENKIEEARNSIEEVKNAMKVISSAPKEIVQPQETVKPLKHTNNGRIRALSDIPQFVWADQKQYGPFKIGDVAEVPVDVRALLIARNAAELVVE